MQARQLLLELSDRYIEHLSQVNAEAKQLSQKVQATPEGVIIAKADWEKFQSALKDAA